MKPNPGSLLPEYERSREFIRLVERWPKVRGNIAIGKYTQRILPEGIKLDLFMVNPDNWGLILAIRTGSANYSHHILACGWVRNGYKSAEGMLSRNGVAVPVREEIEVKTEECILTKRTADMFYGGRG